MSSQEARIAARLSQKGVGTATDRLVNNATAIFDDTFAELIRADSDGTALRGAGFVAAADAVDERVRHALGTAPDDAGNAAQ